MLNNTCMYSDQIPGNKNKEKGNDSGLAWLRESHCYADEFVITQAHSFGTDTQHDNSQGNCRTICRQLQLGLNNDLFIVNVNQIIFFAWNFGLKCWLK